LPNGVAFLGDLLFFSKFLRYANGAVPIAVVPGFQRSVIGAVPIAVVTGYLEIY